VLVPTSGHQKICPTCQRAKRLDALKTPEHREGKRQWRRDNLERDQAAARHRWAAEPERFREGQRRRRQVRRVISPDNFREEKLRTRYGLNLAGKSAILAADKGVCLICGKTAEDGTVLAVDHDHSCCPGRRSCGKCIRGIIHARCNTFLALAESRGFTHPYLDTAPERMRRNDSIRQAKH
jgi:hypothetical protein